MFRRTLFRFLDSCGCKISVHSSVLLQRPKALSVHRNIRIKCFRFLLPRVSMECKHRTVPIASTVSSESNSTPSSLYCYSKRYIDIIDFYPTCSRFHWCHLFPIVLRWPVWSICLLIVRGLRLRPLFSRLLSVLRCLANSFRA